MQEKKNNLGPFTAYRLAVVFSCISFFFYTLLSFTAPVRFSSPDETVNNFFAARFAMTGEMGYATHLQNDANGIVHPRSTFIHDGKIVPVSFVGLPFFAGLAAKVLTMNIVPFFTPILASLGVFFFFLLLRRFLGDRRSLLAASLLMVHPAYWYYANRGMFHNVGFLALLIIGSYCLTHALNERHRRLTASFFWGFTWALALAFRTSEAIWVVGALVGLLVFFWRRFAHRQFFAAIAGAFCIAFPIAIFNVRLFGHPWSFGYIQAGGGGGSGTEHVAIFQQFFHSLFPFGFSFVKSGREAWSYLFLKFFWISLPSAFGIIVTLREWFHRSMQRDEQLFRKVCLSCLLLIGAWLILLYGSWNFFEFRGGERTILGSSYLRYWLPLYALSIPFAVVGLEWIFSFFRGTARLAATYFFAGLIFVLSFQTVFFAPLYGLMSVRESLKQSQNLLQEVQQFIPPNAVVLSGTADKVLFPSYLVIPDINFRDINSRQALIAIAHERPLFAIVNAQEDQSVAWVPMAAQYGILFRLRGTVSSSQNIYELDVGDR